nr:uncharacterized protein LOC128686274 [Cherax quadricarinatus]
MPRDFTDFEFNFLTSDDSEEIIKFLDEQLAPRVPLIKATGETSASLLGKIYMRDVLNCLESGLSFAARHKTTKTIAGVALSEIFSLEETLKVAAMVSCLYSLKRGRLTRALTLLEHGMSVISIATDLKVTRMAIYNLKKAAASLPPGTVPPRKVGSGVPKKTSLGTDNILKWEVARQFL